LGVVEPGEVGAVPVGGDEQVPGRVREPVQQHERALAAVDDQVLLVVALRGAAKDAAILLVRALHVLEPPGRPEPLHGASLPPRRGSGLLEPAGAAEHFLRDLAYRPVAVYGEVEEVVGRGVLADLLRASEVPVERAAYLART